MALLTDEECQADVVVLGTGLTESICAAAFARSGRKVVHLDSSDGYGGEWRSLPLREYISWAGNAADARIPGDGIKVELGGDFRSLPLHSWDHFWKPFPNGRCSEKAAEGPKNKADEKDEASDVSLSEGQRAFALSKAKDRCYEQQRFEWDPFHQIAGIRQIKNELLRNPTAFSIDLVPRLLYGRSEHVDVLIESGVARYLEFQGLKCCRVLTSEGLVSVPLTKSEIFQDAHLSKAEKRMLMRFITSIQPYVSSLAFQSAAQLGVDNATKVKGTGETSSLGLDLDAPWREFLQKQNLSERLQDFITYSICLWDWSPSEAFPQLSCKLALERLGSFISSLGLYGRGTSMPLLYPMYGIAEVAQGFTRLCAVHRGIYALRTHATHLVAQDGRLCGVRTHRGELIAAQGVVAGCGEFLEAEAEVDATRPGPRCRRMTVLFTRPPLGEDGVSLCVVPPDALTPALQNVVQVLQLDYSSGVCPHGYFLAHLSQTFLASSGGPDAANDLDRVLDELMKRCPPETKCIFRCSYLHCPREARRWSDATEAGRFMECCRAAGQLSVVQDPSVVPQLLASQEISEAREVFQKSPVAGAEFLPKPQHVAEEELSGALEELEHFNEQMQAPLEAPEIPAAFSANAGDAEAEETAVVQ